MRAYMLWLTRVYSNSPTANIMTSRQHQLLIQDWAGHEMELRVLARRKGN